MRLVKPVSWAVVVTLLVAGVGVVAWLAGVAARGVVGPRIVADVPVLSGPPSPSVTTSPAFPPGVLWRSPGGQVQAWCVSGQVVFEVDPAEGWRLGLDGSAGPGPGLRFGFVRGAQRWSVQVTCRNRRPVFDPPSPGAEASPSRSPSASPSGSPSVSPSGSPSASGAAPTVSPSRSGRAGVGPG